MADYDYVTLSRLPLPSAGVSFQEYCNTVVRPLLLKYFKHFDLVEGTTMDEKEIKAYRDGFIAGADLKGNFKFHILGYDVNELLDIVEAHKLKQKPEVKPAFEIRGRQGQHYKIYASGKIEGFADGSVVVNRIPELMGAKQPEPSLSPVMKALCSIMTETEVRQGPGYGKLTPGHISAYGAGCIIDGLAAKGYKIIKDTIGLCVDEGCPNHKTPHICVTPSSTKPTVHFDEYGVKLQTDPAKGLQLFVHDYLAYQHNK